MSGVRKFSDRVYDAFASGVLYCEARRGRDRASTDARSVGSPSKVGKGTGHAGARFSRRRVVPRDAGKRRRRCGDVGE